MRRVLLEDWMIRGTQGSRVALIRGRRDSASQNPRLTGTIRSLPPVISNAATILPKLFLAKRTTGLKECKDKEEKLTKKPCAVWLSTACGPVAECDRSLTSRQQSGATKLRLFSSESHRKGTCTVISASLEAAASSISITTSPSIAHGGRWRGSKKEEKGWNRIEGLKGRME